MTANESHRMLKGFFALLLLVVWTIPAQAEFRFCISDLPPISYRGPFSHPQGVLNRLIETLLARANLEARRELLPVRDLARGVLDGSCQAAAAIASDYLDGEELRAWPLMELTLVLIPGPFNRPPPGRLIPAGRYAMARFSSLEDDWSQSIAGFERVGVDSYQEAWRLLEEGIVDGVVGIRENIAWHALDFGTFEVFAEFEIPVAQRKLNLYLAPDLDESVAEKIEEAIQSMNLGEIVNAMEP